MPKKAFKKWRDNPKPTVGQVRTELHRVVHQGPMVLEAWDLDAEGHRLTGAAKAKAPVVGEGWSRWSPADAQEIQKNMNIMIDKAPEKKSGCFLLFPVSAVMVFFFFFSRLVVSWMKNYLRPTAGGELADNGSTDWVSTGELPVSL